MDFKDTTSGRQPHRMMTVSHPALCVANSTMTANVPSVLNAIRTVMKIARSTVEPDVMLAECLAERGISKSDNTVNSNG